MNHACYCFLLLLLHNIIVIRKIAIISIGQIDPYLELIEDIRLQAVCIESNLEMISYGSEEDEAAALKSLSEISSDDQQLKELVLSHLITKCGNLSEVIIESVLVV